MRGRFGEQNGPVGGLQDGSLREGDQDQENQVENIYMGELLQEAF